MNITFTCFGLAFAAECDYEPHVPAQLYGPPERCYPAEGGTAEITALTVDGKDALFLMAGDLADDLNAAAYEACVADMESQREDAQEARAQARADDRLDEAMAWGGRDYP